MITTVSAVGLRKLALVTDGWLSEPAGARLPSPCKTMWLGISLQQRQPASQETCPFMRHEGPDHSLYRCIVFNAYTTVLCAGKTAMNETDPILALLELTTNTE